MSIFDDIDKALPMTRYGRTPCLECSLKHLGTAWFLLESEASSPKVLLERVKILVDESNNGYPYHRHLAVGILNFMERYSPDAKSAREIRRAVFSGENPPLDMYPLPSSLPVPTMEMYVANMIEAKHECPVELNWHLPVKVLIEKISDLKNNES